MYFLLIKTESCSACHAAIFFDEVRDMNAFFKWDVSFGNGFVKGVMAEWGIEKSPSPEFIYAGLRVLGYLPGIYLVIGPNG
jgi:hypothetical protein